ncbi:hypothetical protein I7Z51_002570 [Vibrio parahaemolyticus]|uniref:hypothetical protein n=1 Tax=Vibrio TaxID=662 RepID=UPI001A8D92B3|nr:MULTISPECIES: hypothetical protein [Vibrio]EGQ7973645.1 hypothetical protein [Vibrio parahaemolyticus]MBO0209855.1 hypothetical protein [Vibrio sp. Vb0877]MCR9811917.1 hypothetical protein [Vibrio parahaemolyticus]
MDTVALNNIKELLVNKSIEQGSTPQIATQEAENIIEVLRQPDYSMACQLIMGLVVALMFEGTERDVQVKTLILSLAPQVIPYLTPDKKAKLESLINGFTS